MVRAHCVTGGRHGIRILDNPFHPVASYILHVRGQPTSVGKGCVPNRQPVLQPRSVRQVSPESLGAEMMEVYPDCVRPHAQRCSSRRVTSAFLVFTSDSDSLSKWPGFIAGPCTSRFYAIYIVKSR